MLRRRVDIAASWAAAKQTFAALLAALRELQAAVQARWQAEARLADLYRKRE